MLVRLATKLALYFTVAASLVALGCSKSTSLDTTASPYTILTANEGSDQASNLDYLADGRIQSQSGIPCAQGMQSMDRNPSTGEVYVLSGTTHRLTILAPTFQQTTMMGGGMMGANAQYMSCRTTQVAQLSFGEMPVHVAFRPDGQRAFVTDQTLARVYVIDCGARRMVDSITVGAGAHSAGAMHAGNALWVPCEAESTVYVIDMVSGAVTSTFRTGRGPHAVLWSPDDRIAAVTLTGAQSVEFRTAAAPSHVDATVPVGRGEHYGAFSHDGHTLYITNRGDATISVIDVATHAVTRTMTVLQGPYGFGWMGDDMFCVGFYDASHVGVYHTDGTLVETAICGMHPLSVAILAKP